MMSRITQHMTHCHGNDESQLIHTIKGEVVILYCQEYKYYTLMEIYYILGILCLCPEEGKCSEERRAC